MSQELWSKKKITWLFDVIGSGTTPSASNESYYNSPDKAWLNTGDLTDGYIEKTSKYVSQIALEKYSALTVFPKESLVMAMYGATIGKLGITKYETTTNQACCVLAKPKDVLTKFVFYWLMAHRIEIINLSQGGGQPNISQGIIKNIRIAVPSIELQNKIVSLVDKKFEEINRVIKQKEKVMDLLKQQSQSIITEAVTKGLNPNVKMKDSGVEWIGEIPDHWNIVAFKRISKRVEVGIAEAATHAYRDNGIPIIRATNLKNGKFNEDELLFLSEEFAKKNKSKYIFANDLLTVRTGNAGLTGVVPKSLNMSQCFTMLISTLNVNVNPYFYSYFLNATPGKTYFNLTAWGTAQKNISVPILKEMLVPVFSHFEQTEIVRYLQENISKIDNLVEIVGNQIEKLKEYRQSLIYEMVTGKIDVRSIEID